MNRLRRWMHVPLLLAVCGILIGSARGDSRQLNAASVQQSVGEQLVELPEDGDVWHCSLFVHANWQELKADRELVAAFETDPRLVSLKAQTKWHLYLDSDPFYRQRFAKHVPTLPAVMIQRGNGEVVCKASSDNLDPLQLGGQVVEQIRGYTGQQNYNCYNGRCYPSPAPQPTPIAPSPLFTPPLREVLPRVAVEPIPDLMPAAGLVRWAMWLESNKWLLLAAIAIVYLLWRRRQPQADQTSSLLELLRGVIERPPPSAPNNKQRRSAKKK